MARRLPATARSNSGGESHQVEWVLGTTPAVPHPEMHTEMQTIVTRFSNTTRCTLRERL